MKKNVGDLDALVRIWGGLFTLALGITEDSRFLMVMGAGKVAEGITRICPILYFLGINTKESGRMKAFHCRKASDFMGR